MTENLGQFILSCTDKYRERPAFILRDSSGSRRPLSFFEFNETVRRISLLFRTKYSKSGFKIGLLGENRVEWAALAVGIWHGGGVLVPLMHVSTDVEIQNVINAAGLDALFISPKLYKENNFGVSEVYSMDFNQGRAKGQAMGTLGDLLADGRSGAGVATPKLLQENRGSGQDLAVLIFTSGTTGHPKGVMLSHRNIITNILDTLPVLPVSPGDRAVSILPLSHMFELVGGFTIAHLKGICISYPDSLRPEDVLNEMRTHKATLLVAVPLFFEILDRAIREQLSKLSPVAQTFLKSLGPVTKRFPFLGKIIFRRLHQVFGGHVRIFVTGGAKIDPEIIERFRSMGIQMLQGYGLTETSPIISFTTTRWQKFGSVGKVVTTVKLRIDSPNENGDGEICVTGPSVFSGYFENPQATTEVIRDGWFHTGDVGHVDEKGFVYITGRKKDMIVTPNGKNVYPEELEEILKESPLFNEVAILGLDRGKGEEVHAVVVPSSQTPRDASAQRDVIWKEIEKLCEPLSDYKRVKTLTLSQEELPKTPTKKVRKHLLKEMILAGKLRGESPSAASGPHTPLDKGTDRELWLNEKLQEISKKPEIWKEAHLRHDLAMDSLTFMEVISAMETHWGIVIHDEDFEKINTVDDLLTKLQSSKAGVGRAEAKKKPFDYRGNNNFLMNFSRLFIHGIFIRPMMRIFFKFRVFGKQNLLQKENFVITPNHSSHLDLISVLSSLPFWQINRTYAVAADDYFFNHPLKAFIVRLLFNAIPFERKARIDKSFQVCEEILRNGGNLVIFPEGTRSLTGQMTVFKPGVGRLLAAQGYLSVPAYIQGAYEALPKGSSLPRPSPMAIYFGTPQRFQREPAAQVGYQNVAEVLQKQVEGLRDQLRKETTIGV